mmetsp:Transcript_31971/g.65107  ORF Transcript_31971/g.65107 Transcript_31971/m.65107 type:complete len:217 (+) Transcript_31971:370-1020(+)
MLRLKRTGRCSRELGLPPPLPLPASPLAMAFPPVTVAAVAASRSLSSARAHASHATMSLAFGLARLASRAACTALEWLPRAIRALECRNRAFACPGSSASAAAASCAQRRHKACERLVGRASPAWCAIEDAAAEVHTGSVRAGDDDDNGDGGRFLGRGFNAAARPAAASAASARFKKQRARLESRATFEGRRIFAGLAPSAPSFSMRSEMVEIALV